MRILLVKMSSMGDVIHTLPALTDAFNKNPDLNIDWLIEPAFADIPTWHPAVKTIISVPLRHWRKSLFALSTWRDIKNTFKKIRSTQYDFIIDAQGLLKSAVIAKIARGKIHGLNSSSAREPIASIFYDTKYFVDKNQHAVSRTRELFSKIFNYTLQNTTANYQIEQSKFPVLNFTLEKNYWVFLHGTTQKAKHYPEAYWQELLTLAGQENQIVYLPWGNKCEKERAESLVRNHANAIVLPKLTIAELAAILKNATAVVAVDTGLGHLSAALSTPTISLYGPTDPMRVGTLGNNQIHLCATIASDEVNIHPDAIWEKLQKI